MSEHDSDAQWTEESRQRFQAAASALVKVIAAHSAAVLAMTGRRGDVPAIFRHGDRLTQAAIEYADAQFELTGTFPQWGPLEDEEELDNIDRDEETRPGPVAWLCVLQRADYQVVDPAAVLGAGRHAYQQVWPSDTSQDAAHDVGDIGRALYQVVHAGGLAALGDTPGLVAAGATTWIADATGLLDERAPDDWSANPFALADDVRARMLYRLDDRAG